jgi:hypothetical protein
LVGALAGGLTLLRRPGLPRFVGLLAGFCFLAAWATGLSYRQYLLVQNLCAVILVGVGAGQVKSCPRWLPAAALSFFTFQALVNFGADPPPGIDQSDANISLRESAPGECYYGEDALGHFGMPIFRPDSNYYGNADYGLICRFAGVLPLQGDPSDLSVLPQNPPKVMIFSDPAREHIALGELGKAGYAYSKVSHVLIRLP